MSILTCYIVPALIGLLIGLFVVLGLGATFVALAWVYSKVATRLLSRWFEEPESMGVLIILGATCVVIMSYAVGRDILAAWHGNGCW